MSSDGDLGEIIGQQDVEMTGEQEESLLNDSLPEQVLAVVGTDPSDGTSSDAGSSSSANSRFHEIEFELQCLVDGINDVDTVKMASLELEDLAKLKNRYEHLFANGNVSIAFERKREFLVRYRSAKNTLAKMIDKANVFSGSDSSQASSTPFKLPAFDVPKFDGDIERWAAFKADFQSLMSDDRVKNNEMAKRRYLFMALTGDALKLIENLKDESFAACWKIICETYDQPFRRVQMHLDALLRPSSDSSERSLRELLIGHRQHVTGLQSALNELALDALGVIAISLFLDRVSQSVRLTWEKEVGEKGPQHCTLKNFFEFVERQCGALERANRGPRSKSAQPRKPTIATPTSSRKRAIALAAQSRGRSATRQSCPKCREPHFLNKCQQFRELSRKERIQFIVENSICRLCLTASCVGTTNPKLCPKKFYMCHCRGFHHHLLHLRSTSGNTNTHELFNLINNSGSSSSNNNSDNNMLSPSVPLAAYRSLSSMCLVNSVVANSLTMPNESHSLLSTTLVRVRASDQQTPFEVRALLDCGSQLNFATSALIESLQAELVEGDCPVAGILGGVGSVSKSSRLVIQSCQMNFTLVISVLVVDRILDSLIPTEYFNVDSWHVPSKIQLADPHFNIPAQVDLLLSSEVFWKALGSKKLHINASVPEFRESKFGWIATGSMQITNRAENKFVFFVHQDNNELLKSIERFWTIESYETLTPPLSREEQECERLFVETTFRRADGRFVVKLPFKQPPSSLGNSRAQALRRFHYLEKRFVRNRKLQQQYVDCMSEYIQLGHMREIRESDEDCTPAYYIPHHAILKEASTSTKLRVVFDASMKSTSGLALNDVLRSGPVVQHELFSTLIRFRTHKYSFVADITKMYRMVRIHPDCASLQRIFWRDSPDKRLGVFQLETLTFGTKPAPYLATRCLKELALRYGASYPAAAPVVVNDFYVDDVLSGADTVESAQIIQSELRGLLGKAGFQLSKWSANTPEILSGIKEEHMEKQFPLSLDEKKTVKTLGILWRPIEDVFAIRFAGDSASEFKTKRQILSAIAGFYDIMGLFGPVVVFAKYIMQCIWRLSSDAKFSETEVGRIGIERKKKCYDWDEVLPNELLAVWKEFAENLHHLNDVSIPRFISHTQASKRFELHGFADASSKAYGAVIYCRVIDDRSSVKVHLLCSKSRIAPLKQLSIARLELCGALLLAELVHKVRMILSAKIKIELIRLWSDSKVTLSWIASESLKWNVFVAHRVSRIQSLTETCIWDYVESATNPADILSRGAQPQDLVRYNAWFNGPDGLHSHNEPWTDSISFLPNKSESLERKATAYALVVQVFKSDLFALVGEPLTGKFSTEIGSSQGLTKLVRLIAFLLRFRLNTRSNFPKATGVLMNEEFGNALTILIKLAQNEHFSVEIKALKENRQLPTNSKLIRLSPFLDSKGILRVGGRLEHSQLSYTEKHPVLLHSTHKLSRLIVWHQHLTHLHAGPRLLKSAVRRNYWIIGLNSLTKKCLLRCHTCIRLKAKAQEEMMANLPKQRITPSRAFENTGTDYAGPFSIIGKGGRHKVYIKAYVCIFVCFATKAVHLEVVSDLTSQIFLAALTRFISRRAIPAHIYSDNGTTFVGAHNELQSLYSFLRTNEKSINDYAVARGIAWHFIPPRAPHFGGLWESAVKSMKTHLKSVLSDKTFNFEEFTTLLTQIEACMNSRPLIPESSDPDDLRALTPGHFLVGDALTALPSEPLVDISENRIKRFKRREQALQFFWKRWSTEYLNTLQQRTKWRFIKNELKVNDLVLLKEDNLPPTSWVKGRIHELHSGTDGISRVATVRTKSGMVKRPLVKLVYLPTE